jgi:hypothetical protein
MIEFDPTISNIYVPQFSTGRYQKFIVADLNRGIGFKPRKALQGAIA